MPTHSATRMKVEDGSNMVATSTDESEDDTVVFGRQRNRRVVIDSDDDSMDVEGVAAPCGTGGANPSSEAPASRFGIT